MDVNKSKKDKDLNILPNTFKYFIQKVFMFSKTNFLARIIEFLSKNISNYHRNNDKMFEMDRTIITCIDLLPKLNFTSLTKP